MRKILALMALLALPAAAQPVPDSTYFGPQRLVTVEAGRRINLVCMGHGSPTVLFDSGLGTGARTWRLVHGEVAKTTRACAYERAGIGFSDPRSGESDARAIVADLHALLTSRALQKPIVYVGHSLSGVYGVLLQATHPNDISAAVLVDPSFANQFFAMTDAAIAAGAPAQSGAVLLASLHAQSRRARECAALPAPLPNDCVDVPKDLSPELTAALKAQQSRSSYLLTLASERDSFMPPAATDKSADQKELEAVTANFGDKPLVILTSSKPMGGPGLTPAQSAAFDSAWKAGHDRLATLSTRGSNTVVPDAAHNIQHDQPQVVIDAIKKAIADIRG